MRLVSFRVLLLALAAAVVLTGCSDSQPSAGRVARVTERDFKIKAPRTLPAGKVELTVRNHGPDAHELIAVRLHGSGRLPWRRDGMTLDEDKLEKSEVGALEPGEPGGLRRLRVRLSPGRYELFCNMAGHYHGGMHTRVVVE